MKKHVDFFLFKIQYTATTALQYIFISDISYVNFIGLPGQHLHTTTYVHTCKQTIPLSEFN